MKLTAYVDGSYRNNVYGGGCVFLIEGQEEPTFYKCVNNKSDAARLHNVAGELLATISVISFADKLKDCTEIEICYDYDGIEKWVSGEWPAKKNITRKYRDFMLNAAERYSITFVHTTAHSGILYNELADKLAKEAVREFLRQ